MGTRISEQDRQDVIKNRKKHFKVAVKDAPSEDNQWGIDAVVVYTVTGNRNRVLRFSRREIEELTAALTKWLTS